MRLSALIPFAYLEALSEEVDFDFLEPFHQVEYVDFYSRRGRLTPSFLDNGLIETGEALSGTALVSYAKKVNATFIAAPDRLGNWEYNWFQARALKKLWPKENIFITLAGPSPLKFHIQSLLAQRKGFGGICLPYRLNRIPTSARRVHLFGFRNPERWSEYPSGTTLDTVTPIVAAMFKHSFVTSGLMTRRRPSEYMLAPYDHEVARLAAQNMRFMRSLPW